MQQRVKDNPKIEFMWNSVVIDVLANLKPGVRACA